jgi:hypothetical protein
VRKRREREQAPTEKKRWGRDGRPRTGDGPVGTRLPRLLRWLSMLLAVGLVALVIVCPLIDAGGEPETTGERVVRLFAEDVTVRRTALASALGLAVTAQVFFRGRRDREFDSDEHFRRQ